jgi:hypothetical protein
MHISDSLLSICSATERSARALRRLRHRIIISSFVVFFLKGIGAKLGATFLKRRYVVYMPTTRLPRALLYTYIIYVCMR